MSDGDRCATPCHHPPLDAGAPGKQRRRGEHIANQSHRRIAQEKRRNARPLEAFAGDQKPCRGEQVSATASGDSLAAN